MKVTVETLVDIVLRLHASSERAPDVRHVPMRLVRADVFDELLSAVGETAETLTRDQIIAYFEEHCECRPTDVERTSHSHDCDEDACEDARVALGGRPNGCGYRGTIEAIIHTQAARRAIAAAINARARAKATP